MDDQLCVNGIESVDQAGDEEASDLHVEFASSSNVVPEITTQEQVHD